MTKYEDPTTWRLQTPGGIPYRLVERSGDFGWQQTTCTESVLIEATSLRAFVREVFPLPTFLNGLPRWQALAMQGSLPLLARNIHFSNHVPGIPIDPFGADSDPELPEGTYHPILRVDITYDDATDSPGTGSGGDADDNDPTTFLQISCQAAGEYLRRQNLNSRWYNDATGIVRPNTDVDLPAAKLIPMTEWTITWPWLNYNFFKTVMVPRLRAANGKVNSTTYELLFDAPAETVQMVGWDYDEEHQILFSGEEELEAGQYIQNPVRLSVKMLEKNGGLLASSYLPVDVALDPEAPINHTQEAMYIGHNHFWRPEEGVWRRLLINEDNESVHELYDFNSLFAIPE